MTHSPTERAALADRLDALGRLLSKKNTNSDAGFDTLCFDAAAALRHDLSRPTADHSAGVKMTDYLMRGMICISIYMLIVLDASVIWAIVTTSWIFLQFLPIAAVLSAVVFFKAKEDW